MRRRAFEVASTAVFILLASVPGALAQDLGELEKTFHAGIRALDTRDLEAASATVDENVVVFSLFSPFPIRGRSGFRDAVTEYFENYERATFAPSSPQFRAFGTTGLAWGFYQLTAKIEGGPPAYFNGRYLFTYVWTEGTWLVTSMHYSPLQHATMRIH